MAVPSQPGTAPAEDPFATGPSAPGTAPAASPAPQPAVTATPGTVQPVSRVSTALYVIMLAAGIGGGLLASILSAAAEVPEISYVALPLFIVHLVFSLLVTIKAWGAIQDGQNPISPGKAVGFLFIPFFNLYWVFRAFGGYAGQYNAFIERNGINVPRLSGGLFIVQAVLCVVPYVNFVVAPIFFIFLAIKFCGAINHLADATQ
jgi:hypothetical protein